MPYPHLIIETDRLLITENVFGDYEKYDWEDDLLAKLFTLRKG